LLQLKNKSPFAPAIALFPDEEGVDTLYVVVRATFDLGESLTIAEQQLPPLAQDEFWGDPTNSSLKYISDFHTGKPGTDVALVGNAWAPEGNAISEMYVYFGVAEKQKALKVSGNRYWQNNHITAPEPFDTMPLVYELAYGGSHTVEGEEPEHLIEEHNPVGRGFRGKRSDEEIQGMPLPNIEDPNHLIQSPDDTPPPAGFGFIAPPWQPRLQYAGTYDEPWQKTRAPYLPEDFDSRFFNCAHPDLTFDRYLKGGEPIKIRGASARGDLDFFVPACVFSNKVKIAGSTKEPLLNLETVLIEPDEQRLSLTWRAALPCDKKALKVEEIELDLLEIHI
jgi:hypothetical protein